MPDTIQPTPEPPATVLSGLSDAEWLRLRSRCAQGWNHYVGCEAPGKWRALAIFDFDRAFKTKREAAFAADAVMRAEGDRRAWQARAAGRDPTTNRPFAKTPRGRYRITRFHQDTGEVLEEFEVPDLMEVFGDDCGGREAAIVDILVKGTARCGGGAAPAFAVTELAPMPVPGAAA